jgi:hypothetical protein
MHGIDGASQHTCEATEDKESARDPVYVVRYTKRSYGCGEPPDERSEAYGAVLLNGPTRSN